MSKQPADGVRHITGPADFAAAFDVSRETIERLEVYAALLQQWQKAVNLVAPSTLDAIWHRHFADSAQIIRLAPDARSWIDIGSGAGFPGLVVAILLADASRLSSPSPLRGGDRGGGISPKITLIESDQRKCAFLREVARNTGIAVDILSTRIELAATQSKLERPEVVTARALAPLDRLLGLAAPLFTPVTLGVFLKGRDAAAEIKTAAKTWDFAAEMVPSITETAARIVVIRDLQPKPKD